MADHYNCIIIGTGFAGTFFLNRYLAKRPQARVLILEKGKKTPRNQMKVYIQNIHETSKKHYRFEEGSTHKPWWFTVAFGGSSNSWFGNTPRFLPEDFEMQTRFGHGVDWPLSYNELESYYCKAERIMQVSGPNQNSILFPRSEPYPQPAHLLSTADKAIQNKYPKEFFPIPTARPVRSTKNRPACCATGVCNHCPIDSKFRVENECSDLFSNENITFHTDAVVGHLIPDSAGNSIQSVEYRHKGKIKKAKGDVIVLAANGLFNPFLLLKSGLTDGNPGRGINEQIAIYADLRFSGVRNFDGSTSTTGHGYTFCHGRRRQQMAGCLIETSNVPFLRPEYGRHTERMVLKLIYEDLRLPENKVLYDAEYPNQPVVSFKGHSEYALKALEKSKSLIESLTEGLPVESFSIGPKVPTEAHIQGSVPMGKTLSDSVVDKGLIHHKYRNLIVAGSSSFPTSPALNPTLTISALSLMAADRYLS